MTSSPVNPELERRVALAFAPLDKAALGLGVAAASAVAVATLTILSLLRDPTHRFPLELLDEYFYGFSVSWSGALIGAGWAALAGFCWGWFLAFARNLYLAIWLMTLRVQHDLQASREFLDHL